MDEDLVMERLRQLYNPVQMAEQVARVMRAEVARLVEQIDPQVSVGTAGTGYQDSRDVDATNLVAEKLMDEFADALADEAGALDEEIREGVFF